MKTFKKILLFFGILFFLLIGAIIAIPFLFKDKVNETVKREINKQLNATVDYSNVKLGLIKSFPNLRFSVDDLTVIGKDAFENDTLLRAKLAAIDLDIKKVVKGETYQVNSVLLDKILVNAIVLPDSSANWDILPEKKPKDEEKETKPFELALDKLQINEGYLIYDNQAVDEAMMLENLNLDGSANYKGAEAKVKSNVDAESIYVKATSGVLTFEDIDIDLDGLYNDGAIDVDNLLLGMSQFAYESETANAALNNVKLDLTGGFAENVADVQNLNFDIEQFSLNSGGVQYLNNAHVKSDIKGVADLGQAIFDLQDIKLSINALELLAKGQVIADDSKTDLDLEFSSNKNDFKSLLSLIPAAFTKDFNDVDASGLLELSGTVKGTLAENVIPAFNAHLKVENGTFKYPDLPTAVEDIQIAADITNTTNSIEGIEIDLPKAHIKVAQEPIDFSLNVKNPVKDPFVDLKANGKFDLAKIPDFFPIGRK